MFIVLPEIWYQWTIIVLGFAVGILSYLVLVPAKPTRRGHGRCLTPYACDVCDTCGKPVAWIDRAVTCTACVPPVDRLFSPSPVNELLLLAEQACKQRSTETLDLLEDWIVNRFDSGEPAPVVIPPINRPEVDADWLPRGAHWCSVCDRPYHDCACAENGGTY